MADNIVNLNEYNKTDEEKLYSPCDDCEYKMLRMARKCTKLMCVYAMLNKCAQMMWRAELIDKTEAEGRHYSNIAEYEERNPKLKRLHELIVEKEQINNELEDTSCKDFPQKAEQLENLRKINDEIAKLNEELGFTPK